MIKLHFRVCCSLYPSAVAARALSDALISAICSATDRRPEGLVGEIGDVDPFEILEEKGKVTARERWTGDGDEEAEAEAGRANGDKPGEAEEPRTC